MLTQNVLKTSPSLGLPPATIGHQNKSGAFVYNAGLDIEDLGAGDSSLKLDILSDEVKSTVFESLLHEVEWKTMFHRGGEVPRLVAVQGELQDDGSFPIYRHPADASPPLLSFSPTVLLIKAELEKRLEQPFNHVLIQHYRSGADYISDHSDKTIDVVRNTSIVNVSLGSERVMTLRRKRDTSGPGGTPRFAQKFVLPHNSMFVMGSETNKRWLHGIARDKGLENDHEGGRISLTFRNIGTWLSKDCTRIWGQGATGKTKDNAQPVISGEEASAELIESFSKENNESEFDWEAVYGVGSDVLHFVIPS